MQESFVRCLRAVHAAVRTSSCITNHNIRDAVPMVERVSRVFPRFDPEEEKRGAIGEAIM